MQQTDLKRASGKLNNPGLPAELASLKEQIAIQIYDSEAAFKDSLVFLYSNLNNGYNGEHIHFLRKFKLLYNHIRPILR